MRFWIVKFPDETNNTMAIDDASLRGIDLPSWPADVDFINWNGKSGEIRYWTQPGITVPFVDPTPYVPYINNWLTKAARETLPINLDQARKVKSDLVESLFDVKRQLPISMHDRVWDCCDETVNGMARMLLARQIVPNGRILSLTPFGLATAIPLTTGQLAEMVVGIETRRASLHGVRQQKKVTIASMPTVEECIGFDVLSGW
jgi:hypothetical protein